MLFLFGMYFLKKCETLCLEMKKIKFCLAKKTKKQNPKKITNQPTKKPPKTKWNQTKYKKNPSVVDQKVKKENF